MGEREERVKEVSQLLKREELLNNLIDYQNPDKYVEFMKASSKKNFFIRNYYNPIFMKVLSKDFLYSKRNLKEEEFFEYFASTEIKDKIKNTLTNFKKDFSLDNCFN